MNKQEAQSSDYFGTFLETVQHSGASGQEGAVIPLKALVILDERGPQDVRALQEALGLDVMTFSRTLQTLIESNLAMVEGEAGNELVSLTDQGQVLARMQSGVSAS